MVENLGIGKLYENKVGALFVQCFFLSVFYLSWNIAGEQYSCLFTFSSLRLRESREIKKEINKFHALANSQERRKRK